MPEGLDCLTYEGENYARVMSGGSWRVAMLNHGSTFVRPTYLERHLETDEVFVLLDGEATLLVGETCKAVSLERNRIYNVRKAVWHQIVTKPGARCLVVENDDTSLANSERKPLA